MQDDTPPAASRSVSSRLRSPLSGPAPQKLKEIDEKAEPRIDPGLNELSQVLGGGIVPGSMILIGGDPGIGKSTLLLQTAIYIAQKFPLLYVSGEESERQIKMRAARLIECSDKKLEIPDNLLLLTETSLNAVLAQVRDIRPKFLVIDSIQTMQLDEMESAAGSISQVRECAAKLREVAKMNDITVFVIGHVTKEGSIAGPRVLEHIVDTVLYLEGDRFLSLRLLRSVKNRYGATSEVGVFDMQEEGLVEVNNPSEVFLAERMINAPGSSIVVTMEGTRPLLVEIQGLTNPCGIGNPRRTPLGVDMNRLFLITAVLTRRIGIRLGEQDVFVNVVGGMRISEPAADLAIAAAIVSSAKNRPVRADAVLIGEIGLSGELRGVSKIGDRLKEAARMGFKTAVIPCTNQKIRDHFPKNINVVEVRSLRDALKAVLLPAVDEK